MRPGGDEGSRHGIGPSESAVGAAALHLEGPAPREAKRGLRGFDRLELALVIVIVALLATVLTITVTHLS
jgi:hypothetical protein